MVSKPLSPFPFLESLQEIASIKFTSQQVNILSCYVSGKSVDTTASLLGIAPKTVETHTSKITLKLNIQYSGRQKIILFAERSDKYEELREHYAHLLKWYNFIELLKEIKETLPDKKLCNVTWENRLLKTVLTKALKALGLQYRTAKNHPHIHLTNSGGIKFNGKLYSFYKAIFALLKYLYSEQFIENFEIQFNGTSNKVINKNSIDSDGVFESKISTNKVILLPKTTVVAPLPRQTLLNHIKDKLNGKDIRVVSFFGIGGSGKSTLAQNYACQSDADVICYINAGSKESVHYSFKQLAYELLQDFSEAVSFPEMMNKLKYELKKRSNKWLLIYDNIKNFDDLESNFPFSFLEWGEGEVILTSRNESLMKKSNLTNISHIYVGELTKQERHNLFVNILGEERDENLDTLLAIIPPFPLDISTAAHYLKENNHITYLHYINLINNPSKDFSDFQDEIFVTHNSYGCTRYKIVETSLEGITQQDEENISILLFISLLYPGDISKQILYALDNNYIKVDRLIFNLKNSGLVKVCIDSISFHSILHASIFLFVTKTISCQVYQNKIKSFTDIFRTLSYKVIEEDNFWEAHKLVNSLEYFLTKIQDSKTTTSTIGSNDIYKEQAEIIALFIRLNTYLARLHSYLLNCSLSLKYRESAWTLCHNLHGKYHHHTLITLLSLGSAWEACGTFSKAREIYSQCLEISNCINGESHEFTEVILLILGALGKRLDDDINPIFFNKIPLSEVREKIVGLGLLKDKNNNDKLFNNHLDSSIEEIKEIIEDKTGVRLTPSETFVLCSMGLSLTVKQTAYFAQMAPRTIECYLHTLLRKLNLRRKSDLQNFIYRNDLDHILLLTIKEIEKRSEFLTRLKQVSQEHEIKLKLYIPRINYINQTLNKIKGHLMLARIRFDEDDPNGCEIPLYIVGNFYPSKDHIKFIKKPIYLCLNKDNITNTLSLDLSRLVDFTNEKEYSSSFLKLLKLLRNDQGHEEQC